MQGLEACLEAVANRVQSLEEVVLLLRQTADLDPDPIIHRVRWEQPEGNIRWHLINKSMCAVPRSSNESCTNEKDNTVMDAEVRARLGWLDSCQGLFAPIR